MLDDCIELELFTSDSVILEEAVKKTTHTLQMESLSRHLISDQPFMVFSVEFFHSQVQVI